MTPRSGHSRYENIVFMREALVFALFKCPAFSPEDGRTREFVLKDLRHRLARMRDEWWGGEQSYNAMEQLLSAADAALDANDTEAARRAFGEIYKIIDQTPRPKLRSKRSGNAA